MRVVPIGARVAGRAAIRMPWLRQATRPAEEPFAFRRRHQTSTAPTSPTATSASCGTSPIPTSTHTTSTATATASDARPSPDQRTHPAETSSSLALTARTAPSVGPMASFRNCTALHRVYPHGSGKCGARDHTSGTPVTNFKRSNRLYLQNSRLDRDKDGIACEKR
jgi:Excalibur calcium-binding domain